MGLWPFGGSKSSDSGSGTGASTTTSASPQPTAAPAADGKPKKKICCACPDTKRLRDECIAERGEEHPYCAALIEAHKACLRMEGFNV